MAESEVDFDDLPNIGDAETLPDFHVEPLKPTEGFEAVDIGTIVTGTLRSRGVAVDTTQDKLRLAHKARKRLLAASDKADEREKKKRRKRELEEVKQRLRKEAEAEIEARADADGDVVVEEDVQALADKKWIAHKRKEEEAERRQRKQTGLEYGAEAVTGMESQAFRFQARRRETAKWGKEDTAKFYRAVKTFQANFAFIADLFPGRTVRDIRDKFRLESRARPKQIEEAVKANKSIDIAKYREYKLASDAARMRAAMNPTDDGRADKVDGPLASYDKAEDLPE
eukprot:gene378-540_t